MKIYIVLCRYDGCEECNSGAHVVAALPSRKQADVVASAHEKEKDAHLHSWWAEVVEMWL